MAVYREGRKNEIVGITKKEKTVRLKFLKFCLREGRIKMKRNNIKEIVGDIKRTDTEKITCNVLERVFITIISGLAVWSLYIAFTDTVTGFQELWHTFGRAK